MLKSFFHQSSLEAADIGAHGGVIEHWSPYINMMRVSAFEPNEKECENQAKKSHKNITWHPFALAGKTEKRNLFILNRETGSSLYQPNLEVMDQFNSESYSGIREV